MWVSSACMMHRTIACDGLTLGSAEQGRESFLAGTGKIDDAAAGRGIARRPFQFGEARHQRRAEGAGEVMPALAPVETGFAHWPARMGQHIGFDLQVPLQETRALRGEFDILL